MIIQARPHQAHEQQVAKDRKQDSQFSHIAPGLKPHPPIPDH